MKYSCLIGNNSRTCTTFFAYTATVDIKNGHSQVQHVDGDNIITLVRKQNWKYMKFWEDKPRWD